jgi:uncharacterized protein
MNLVEFSEFIVKNLTKESDLVKVKDFESEEGIILQILVSESDMGRVIGKGGKTANAIKSIIQAKAYSDNIKNVKINIDSF